MFIIESFMTCTFVILDTQIFPHSDEEESLRLPLTPKRDIEVEDIEIIAETLEQSRKRHHIQKALPIIRINSLAYVETS